MNNMLKAAVFYISKPDENHYYLKEFIDLARNAGYQTATIFNQSLEKPSPHSYFGSGKLLEIKEIIENNRHNPSESTIFDYILVNDDLSPLQKKTIEEILSLPVVDRTSVILQIFEQNAKSKEAKLQVEIAALRYTSNRLINALASYSQVTSGKGKNKGEGEKALELSKRQIENKILFKNKQLEEIKLSRRTSRKKRNDSPIPKVAVVGYTNAGKSSLINGLLNYQHSHPSKSVLVKDDVFATLETSTRLINCFGFPAFYVTDTVGFISNLPIYLIDAFRSTLEEIGEADLIVEVIDFSDAYYREHIKTTAEVLAQLGVEDIPIIYLFNKYDQIASIPTSLPKSNELYSTLLPDENNITEVLNFIALSLANKWEKKNVVFPFENDFYRFMTDNYVISYEQKEDGYHCSVYLNPKTLFKYAYLFKPRD